MATDSNIRLKNHAGGSEDLKAVFDGAASVESLMFQLAVRGYCWNVTVGSFSTPITGGGAGTVLDADQPELVIDVPNGFAACIFEAHIQLQPPLIASDSDECDCVIGLDRTAVSGATASNGTVETPINYRTDITAGCPLSVVSAVTTNLSAGPTVSAELQREQLFGDVQGTAANAIYHHARLDYMPRVPLWAIGPATFFAYWGGTVATTGFAQVSVCAIPASKITNLVA